VADDYFFEFYQSKRIGWRQWVELRSTLIPLRLFVAKRGKRKKQRRRDVLLERLLPVRRATKLKRAPWLKQARRLQGWWRRRFEQFDINARLPERMRVAKRCRNCKPAFFPTNGKRWYCEWSACPHCHARGVFTWFKRLAYALHNHQFSGTMVVRTVRYDQPIRDEGDNLAKAFDLAKTDIKRFSRSTKPDASLSFVQLLPGRSQHDATVVVQQLLYFLGEFKPDPSYTRVVKGLTLGKLQQLVCYVLRYPPACFYRNPVHALRVFTVLRDRNLITATGLFYRHNKEELYAFDLRTIR
jgi:hypothetical protein